MKGLEMIRKNILPAMTVSAVLAICSVFAIRSAQATIINYDPVAEFIAGVSAGDTQSPTVAWQYFAVNDAKTTATLLTWDTAGNEITTTTPQWDLDGGGTGKYPFVLKTGAGGDAGNFSSGAFPANTLWFHPSFENYGVAIGWYNDTGYTATVSYSGSLGTHGQFAGDGVNYFVRKGSVSAANLQTGHLADTSGNTAALNGSGISMASGEILYFMLDRNGAYQWDHTRLILTLTAEFEEVGSAVPEPSTYALSLIGLAGLGLVAWRRKRSA